MLEKSLLLEIKKILPHYNNPIIESIDSKTNQATKRYYCISREYHLFRDSDYYYSDSSNLIHFTSLAALNSIVSERSIRLYDLNAMNDPREFSYASEMLLVPEDSIKLSKSELFSFSFCKSFLLQGKTKRKEFNLWRLYGKEGEGVIIEFEIANNKDKWKDFYLSEVKYGYRQKMKFKKISNFLKQLDKTKPNVYADLSPLLCFHKSGLYDNEFEVKLIYDYRKTHGWGPTEYSKYKKKQFPKIRMDILKNNINVRFLELSLLHHNFKQINESIPLLKIKRIVIGYKHKNIFTELIKAIKDLCLDKLGYYPKIELARVTKDYFGK